MHNQSSKKHGRQVAMAEILEGRKATDLEGTFNVDTYLHIARDLCYPQRAIDELQKCKSHNEASRVMKGARNGEYG